MEKKLFYVDKDNIKTTEEKIRVFVDSHIARNYVFVNLGCPLSVTIEFVQEPYEQD